MKDYEHVVIWQDYFNKALPRSGGRRLGREKCVASPSLKELADAAAAAGFEVTESNEKARFPKTPHIRSGYIVLPKKAPKTAILNRISGKLVSSRARRSKQN